MKKSLLLGVALVSAVAAYAQSDITPANYKFATATEIPWYFNTDDETTALTNVNIKAGSSNVWGEMEFEKFWKDGLWVLTSAGQNWWQQRGFRNGWSIIDMGGEVGKVAAFVGKACNIVDKLTQLQPDMAENWNKLAVDTSATGGWQLHIVLDPATCPSASEGYIHTKMVFNVYSPAMGANRKVFQNIGLTTNANGLEGIYEGGQKVDVFQSVSNKPENTVYEAMCIERYEDGEPVLDDYEQPTWDPNQWVVVEFDQAIADPDPDKPAYTPARLRLNAMNGNVWNDYAFFLKELSFTQMEGYASDPNFKVSMETIKPFGPSDGVETIMTDNDAPVEYYNLNGVKVANPEKGIYIKKQGNKATKVVL